MSARKLHDFHQGLSVERVLRHRTSRDYFRDGTWTSNPAEATTFRDAVEAAQVCARLGLENVELALRFRPDTCDMFCTPIR